MNLLVANTRNAQAYAIIRALRPYAEKIVVTMYGKNRLSARLSHAANSRLVDKRYYVPSPVEDWRAGNIGRENTEREEAYVQAVERICEIEKIDTIFGRRILVARRKSSTPIFAISSKTPWFLSFGGSHFSRLWRERRNNLAGRRGFPCVDPRGHHPAGEGQDLRCGVRCARKRPVAPRLARQAIGGHRKPI